MIRFAIAIAAFFSLAVPVFAQQTSCANRSTFITVIDERGLPVRGLTAREFRAGLRGQTAKIISAQEDMQPRHVLLLLDTGANMRDTESGKWQLALEVATHMVQNVPRNDDLKLAIFGKPGKPGLHPTPGESLAFPADIFELTQGLPLVGRAIQRPPLFDALADGLHLLEKPRPGDVIFVVADGANESSKTKFADLEHLLLAAGVRLFAVTMPMRHERAGLTVNAPAYSEDREDTDFINLASVSGGKSLRVLPKFYPNAWGFHFDEKERMALATSLQLLYLQMAHFYRVNFELAKPPEKTSEFDLDVVDAAGKSRKTVRVLFPRKLEPCASPPVN